MRLGLGGMDLFRHEREKGEDGDMATYYSSQL
jgi:hypothetical protein